MNRIFSLLITSFIICFGKIRIWRTVRIFTDIGQFKKNISGPLELYHFLIAQGISVEQPYCKILDFLRLTLPWTHPILNPVFYSFIGTWIHCSDWRTFRLSQAIDVLGPRISDICESMIKVDNFVKIYWNIKIKGWVLFRNYVQKIRVCLVAFVT